MGLKEELKTKLTERLLVKNYGGSMYFKQLTMDEVREVIDYVFDS